MSDFKPHDYVPDLQAMGDCRICGAADERACLRANLAFERAAKGTLDGLDFDGVVSLQLELSAATKRAEDARTVLRDHHQWHLDAGTIGLPDGEGGWVEMDDAAEYGDSLLYERTQKVLEGLPADDAGPMPRGGISAWWWAQGVLERRKRRAAEHRAATAEARVKAWYDMNDRNVQRLIAQRQRATSAEYQRDQAQAEVERKDAALRNLISFIEDLAEDGRHTKVTIMEGGIVDQARQALSTPTPHPWGEVVRAVIAETEAERAAQANINRMSPRQLWTAEDDEEYMALQAAKTAARKARRKACAAREEKTNAD